MEMDYTKVDPEEPKVREVKEKPCNIMQGQRSGEVKSENVKNLIMEGIKVEKLKNWIVARSQLARLNLWVVGVVTLLLLRACVVQLRTLSETISPRSFLSRSSFHVEILPESKCFALFRHVMINSYFAINREQHRNKSGNLCLLIRF